MAKMDPRSPEVGVTNGIRSWSLEVRSVAGMRPAMTDATGMSQFKRIVERNIVDPPSRELVIAQRSDSSQFGAHFPRMRIALPILLAFQLIVLSFTGSAQWAAVGPLDGRMTSALSLHDTLLVGTTCGVYRSTDNGNTFVPHSRGIPSGPLIDLVEHNGVIYASNFDKGIYTSFDRGVTWQLSLPGRYLRQDGFDWQRFVIANDAVVARGYDEDSLYYSTNGIDWQQQAIAAGLFSMLAGANNVLYCWSSAGPLGAETGLYRSTDLGVTWQLSGGTSQFMEQLYGVGNTLYAFGDRTFTSTNNGLSFTQSTTAPATFGATYSTYDGTRFYLHRGGNAELQFATWQPGQTSWQPMSGGLPTMGNTTCMVHHNGRLIVGRLEHTYTSTNNGNTWTATSLPGINSHVLNDLYTDEQGALAVSDTRFLVGDDAASDWNVTVPVNLSEKYEVVRTAQGFVTITDGFAGIVEVNVSATGAANSWTDASINNAYAATSTLRVSNDTLLLFGNDTDQGDVHHVLLLDLVGQQISDLSAGLFGPSFNNDLKDLVEHNGDYYAIVSARQTGNSFLKKLDIPTGTFWTTVVSQLDGEAFKATALATFNSQLYMGLNEGEGVLVSNDDGLTWSSMNDGLGALTPRSFLATPEMLFMTSDRGVYYLLSGSDTWVDVSNDLLVGDVEQVGITDQYLWARVEGGGAWRLPLAGNVAISERATTALPLTLRPNPTTDRIQLQVDESNSTVFIHDATGRLVLTQAFNVAGSVELDLIALPAGLYRCTVHSASVSRSASFVKH